MRVVPLWFAIMIDCAASLRICLVCEPSPLTYVSGVATRFQKLIEYLALDANDQVELITTEVVATSKPQQWIDKVPVHYVPGWQLPLYPNMTVGGVDWTFRLARKLRKNRPDLLHVTSPGFLMVGAILWGRLMQIPLVVSYHTHIPVYVRSYCPAAVVKILEWFVWLFLRVSHSLVDATVVTSPQILEEFHKHGIPRCHLWQKGIDCLTFHGRHRNQGMRSFMTSGEPDCFLLVYVGRLAREKRLERLSAVMERMPRDTRLCFVGTGPDEEQLRDLFGQDDRVVFTGLLSDQLLSQAYASADVFCMPSDSETLGFVVLESMASGVPVVGVPAGGLLDLIQHNVTGYLANSTEDFQRYLMTLKSDDDLRSRMGFESRREAEFWSWGQSMKKLRCEVYGQAIRHADERWEKKVSRKITASLLSAMKR